MQVLILPASVELQIVHDPLKASCDLSYFIVNLKSVRGFIYGKCG